MNKEMNDLIDQAEREGKWLRCLKEDVWFEFSPLQLRTHTLNEKFISKVLVWDIFDPQDDIKKLEFEIEQKQLTLKYLKKSYQQE